MNYQITRELIRALLQRPFHHPWTLQGFGMLRLNLAKVGRIHVWDDRFAVADVSVIHTHPWPLESTVINGKLTNIRYASVSASPEHSTHLRQTIATGEGGGLVGVPQLVKLYPEADPETYVPGDTYRQDGDEIHESRPDRGTVTLLRRPKGAPLEHAFVYWPKGQGWVSAEPRPARRSEVSEIIGTALGAWKE